MRLSDAGIEFSDEFFNFRRRFRSDTRVTCAQGVGERKPRMQPRITPRGIWCGTVERFDGIAASVPIGVRPHEREFIGRWPESRGQGRGTLGRAKSARRFARLRGKDVTQSAKQKLPKIWSGGPIARDPGRRAWLLGQQP